MLSIVIPTKNEEKYLPVILGSIKKQTYKDFEIIVPDAKSNDRTRIIAKKYGCKVVDGALPGPGRNRGAAKVKGKYILFLDADVSVPDDFLEKMITEFEQRSLDIATCYASPISNKFKDLLMFKLMNILFGVFQYFSPIASGWCILVKTNLHKKLNGFDETITLSEDVEYVRRAAKIAKFRVLRKPKIYVSTRRFEMEGRVRIIKKYFRAWVLKLRGKEVRGNLSNSRKYHYNMDYKK
jgi:glycosyltransferase involved in cell wall biosynthesis